MKFRTNTEGRHVGLRASAGVLVAAAMLSACDTGEPVTTTDAPAPAVVDSSPAPETASNPLAALTAAAEAGDAQAQYDLARAYETGSDVEKDLSKAAVWYLKAADQGVLGAQANLGLMYWRGNGVEQDHEKAAYWSVKAAEGGSRQGAYVAAQMLTSGEGVEPDAVAAWKWASVAQSLGFPNAGELVSEIEAGMSAEQVEAARTALAEFESAEN